MSSVLATALPEVPPNETAALAPYVSGLSDDKVQIFANAYRAERKNPTTFALLSLFTGGGQWMYFGNFGKGVLWMLTGGMFVVGAIMNAVKAKDITTAHNLTQARVISTNLK